MAVAPRRLRLTYRTLPRRGPPWPGQFTGPGLGQRYGLQFRKLVAYVRTKYLPRAPSEARAAAFRLDLLIESFERGEGVPSKLVEDQPAELDTAWSTVHTLFHPTRRHQ